ncbi:MAG: Acetoacetate decarboxylase, partial [uncultured Solirubrobacteraceae bacterium]
EGRGRPARPDDADRSAGLPARRAVPVHRPRVPQHHLPHRPRRDARRGARAADRRRPARDVRGHEDAGRHRARRVHRVGAGADRPARGRAGGVPARDVRRQPRLHHQRARDQRVPEEVRQRAPAPRRRHPRRDARLPHAARGHRDDGVEARAARGGGRPRRDHPADVRVEDAARLRPAAAHLRAGPQPDHRPDGQGRLDRPGAAAAVRARPGAAGRPAGARDRVRVAHPVRPDARPADRRARLPGGL